jgi:NADP-dependent 3-hydroxy acid dehydrogenase YdfG/acyl carrier protein
VADATPSAGELTVRSDASYLITGGLGGLGLATAAHLAARGARALFLLGRQAPGDSARRQIAAIEQTGARVHIRTCDVAHQEALAAVLAEIERNHPALRGVIHAAGQLDDGVVLEQSWARFEALFAPKIAGTWNLHRLTAALPLDWFIVFGAGAAVFGEAGQANYAAANAFVDAFAHWRRALRLPASTIDWGPWSEVGMAARSGILRTFAERGVIGLSSAEALAALEAGGDEARAQTIAIRMNWPRYFARTERTPAILDDLGASEQHVANAATPQSNQTKQATLETELASTPAALRSKVLLRFVSEQIRKAIGLPADHPIDPQQPLQELGLDSLMAIELRNGISAASGCTFPATMAFDYPVPQALAERLGEMLSSGAAPAAGGPMPRATTTTVVASPPRDAVPAQTLAEMTENEANELLLRELQELRAGADE